MILCVNIYINIIIATINSAIQLASNVANPGNNRKKKYCKTIYFSIKIVLKKQSKRSYYLP